MIEFDHVLLRERQVGGKNGAVVVVAGRRIEHRAAVDTDPVEADVRESIPFTPADLVGDEGRARSRGSAAARRETEGVGKIEMTLFRILPEAFDHQWCRDACRMKLSCSERCGRVRSTSPPRAPSDLRARSAIRAKSAGESSLIHAYCCA